MKLRHVVVAAVLAVAGCRTHDRASTSGDDDVTVQATTFALGSSEAEVKAAMGGAPTKLDETFHQWEYDFSSIDFEDGKVIGWHERDRRLATRYDPHDPKAAAAAKKSGGFTKGASRDEVYGVEGVPTEIDHTFNQWEYGFSTVTFDGDGRVSGWSSRDRALHVR